MRTIGDFDVKEKRVLVRCDFNVPLSEKGIVLDDFRVKAAVPTVEHLLSNKAKIILMSHLGKPEGKVVKGLRMTPVQDKLMEYLGISIVKAPDCVGKEVEKLSQETKIGEILLLENLRFHKEEEENDDVFIKELAKLGDVYINDAFGACHRAHASIVGVPKYLPSAAGLLLEKEIGILLKLKENPEKPLIAIIGGKKVETKAAVIDRMSETADFILIGGLLKKEIEQKNFKFKNPEKIIGPVDEVYEGRDIGPKTINLFQEKIFSAKTVFWNGPLGQTEKEEFQKGTKLMAQAVIESNAFSVIGGGETVEFVNRFGLAEKFNHVSTGGGAMLAFLSGEGLPGLKALNYGN